jgi:anti-sigma factor RsiW
MTCPSAEGNRNALLALHFGECDALAAAETRTHVEACPACGEYLATLSELSESLTKWHDEAPPAGMGQRIVAQAVRSPQPPFGVARPPADALPLLGLLPVMGALLTLIRLVAAWLPALSFWPRLEQWPALQPIVPFAAATVALLALGGLATLAAAPALVLETRR